MGLRSDLLGRIPEHLVKQIPEGYEVLGNIAIISVPPEIIPYHNEIIKALLTKRPSLVTILNKVTHIQGQERTAEFFPIFGNQFITTVREFGLIFQLDVRDVYFSTKMASERNRIRSLIKPGETIFVPFAGAGPYAITAAAAGAGTIAIEISEPACYWMNYNATINHVASNLHIIRGDALQAIHFLKRYFSRIIIPTPYGLLKKPDIYLSKLEKNGIAHWITFCNTDQINNHVKDFSDRGYEVMRCHRCGNVAPSVSRWILDIRKP